MAVKAEVKGNQLHIIADLDGTSSSKTGKSTIVATTAGFQTIGEYRYSLNVIKAKR
jgi:hypothetical protein